MRSHWLVWFAAVAAAASCDSSDRKFNDGQAGASGGGSSGASAGGSAGKGSGGSGNSTQAGSGPAGGDSATGGAPPEGGTTGTAGDASGGSDTGEGGEGGAGPRPCEAECFCEGEYCATVQEVEVSTDHSCALMASGNVWCWGENNDGQLGIAGFTDEPRPKRLESIDGVIDLAIGYSHSCAVKAEGTVWCWGSNESSALGDNDETLTITYEPVQVVTAPDSALTGIQAIEGDSGYTCALKGSDGSVWCWGAGNLGNNTETSSPVAVRVVDAANVAVIGASRIFADSGVAGAFFANRWNTWGASPYHGQNDLDYTIRATAMAQDRDYTSIAIGSGKAYGVDPAGDLWYWPGADLSAHDQETLFDNNVRKVVAGYIHACVLKADDVVACYGTEYDNGALGDGDPVESLTPVDVLDDVVYLAGSTHHSCAIRKDDSVWCWGRNYSGQIGNDTFEHPVDVPVAVLPVPPQ